MIALIFMSYVIIWSLINKKEMPKIVEEFSFIEKVKRSKQLLPVILLISAVIGSIYTGIATATEFPATLGEFTTLRADKIENDTSNHALEIGTQGTGPVKIGQTEISTTASTITGLVTNGDITISPQGTGAVTTANQLTLTGSFRNVV